MQKNIWKMKIKNQIIYILILFNTFVLNGQKNRFDSIYLDISKYYLSSKENDKLKMLDFIKANIRSHFTDSYYWTDSIGTKIDFDELEYVDFNQSVQAFEKLKLETGPLRASKVRIPDIVTISKDILYESIESTYKFISGANYPNDIVHEYLLPYRIMNEPLYEWRKEYNEQFKFFLVEHNEKQTISNIIDNINQWFICTYGIETRSDPLSSLGSLQLLHRKKGGCEDAANLMVFALRSVGIPCAIDIIPCWGTSTGGHVLNSAFDNLGNPIHFDALINSDSLYELPREPGKVFRKIYSNNIKTLPFILPEEEIPNNRLLRSTNYIDVTKEYANVTDIKFSIHDSLNKNIIYACVFNGGKWKPVWYGSKIDSSVVFTDLVEGVIYLPMVYSDGNLIPVGHPKAFSNYGIVNFIPTEERISIKLSELPGYLKFRMGVVYTLYYYDKKWIKIDRKIPNTGTEKIIFHNVPKNALLLLRPKDSKGKERPFTINDKGERLWW